MRIAFVRHTIHSLWAVLFIYWFLSAFGNKMPKLRQSRLSRLAYLLGLIATACILSSMRNLGVRILPVNAVMQSLGILVCASGVALAIWARRILGKNWSGWVTIKQEHELIQEGPYRWVRHPIYTGFILAFAGTFLALVPTLRGLLVGMVWVVAFYIKARQEERLLSGEFGDRYAGYKQRVKSALIPFVL